VSILTNDTDVDGNPTAAVNGVGQFSVDLDTATAGVQDSFTNAQGAWTLNPATGEVTFDPATNFNGTATLTYDLCDPAGLCDTALITFVVTAVNDAPVANDDDQSATPLTEDGANGAVSILTNDTDVDGNPTAAVNGVGQFSVDLDTATAGVQDSFTNAQGAWTLNPATGEVTFDPATNFNGTATLTYDLCDPAGLCDTALITFVVTAVNDAPVLDNDTNSTVINTATTGGDLTDAGDSDPEGTALVVNITPVSGPTNGSIVLNADGTYVYTPNSGFVGTDIIRVEICDSGTPLPRICVIQDLTITVPNGDLDGDGNPDNTDPNPSVPTANDDALSAAFGAAATVNIL
ncbi:tandem-95 repeat protein, partial [Flavobacterium sp. LS1P3]|uniref:tandem-95 repeat protein n=1 Tax=Flavobacterium sp. LS1P3 TaxID=3401720 RepID=UPI003AB06E19